MNGLPVILILGAIEAIDFPGSPLDTCVKALTEKVAGKAEVVWFSKPEQALWPSEEVCDRVFFVFLASHVSSPDYDAFIGGLTKSCPNMKHIHTRTTGINKLTAFDSFVEAEEKGLIVTNARSCFNDTLAEWCLYAMMHFAKSQWKLPVQREEKKYEPFNVTGLKGKTVAILGYGDIGQEIGRMCKMGFGMKVIGLRRNAAAAPYADVISVVSTATLKEAFGKSDFVVCVLPKTPATDGMISDEVLAASHKDLIFVNVGRGANVDQDALVAHLKKGTLKAAALDVQREEPVLQDDELWTLPDDKLLLSPHSCDHSTDIDERSLDRFTFILDSVMEDKFDMSNRTSCKKGY